MLFFFPFISPVQSDYFPVYLKIISIFDTFCYFSRSLDISFIPCYTAFIQ